MGRSVTVVIVTFDSARYLPSCLASIRDQRNTEWNLVVVDNASRDDSLDLVSRFAPDAHIVRNETNRGFAAAVNQGIAVAAAPYVLLLNPDARLMPSYLEHLVASMETDVRVGSAAGTLLRGLGETIAASETIDSMGIRMTRNGRHLDIGAGEVETGAGEGPPREVFGVSGAAAVFRREYLEDLAVEGEIFDEDFFAYREDADLAWRGQLRGWKSLCVPSAIAYHVRRVTPEVRSTLPAEINFHSVKNRFLLRWKNQGGFLAIRNAPFELARDLAVFAGTLTFERSSFPAWGWLWRNRKRIASKRRVIQARRLVPDRELARWFG